MGEETEATGAYFDFSEAAVQEHAVPETSPEHAPASGPNAATFAYQLDSEGNSVPIPAQEMRGDASSDDDDDDSDSPDGGGGMGGDWLYTDRANRNVHTPEWVNGNLSMALGQGIVVDNSYGPGGRFHGTFANAEEHNAWEKQVYSAVDETGAEDFDPGPPAPAAAPAIAPAAAQVAQQPPAAPPPAPPPQPPSWGRPDDPTPGGTGWGDAMAELQNRNPENSGRWSATQAAAFDNDSAFFEQTGLRAAQDAALAAGDALTQGPTYSADQYNDAIDAGTAAGHAAIDADSTRNRYQQTTDYEPSISAAEQHANVDAASADQKAAAQANPADAGIGMTAEQQQARAEAQDFSMRTGTAVDELTPEQKVQLQTLRDADMAQAMQRQVDYEASPEGQAQLAEAQRRQQLFEGEAQRAAASQARAEQVMQTPVDQR